MLATSDTKLHSPTAGANRYETAALASVAYFSSADNVVLCNGRNFPDALSAAPLAKALNAPLLLTEADVLPPTAATEIARLAPSKIWVIGGTSVVSTAVYNQLDATYAMERISGANRYETAAAVAQKGLDNRWIDLDSVGFATGENFPDALGAGAALGYYGSPLRSMRRAPSRSGCTGTGMT